MRVIKLFLIFQALLVLVSCAQQPTPPIEPTPIVTKTPNFIVQKPGNKRVIVFVHGIFGDAFDTWKNKNGKHFYDFVKEDIKFDKADIYTYGYVSTFTGGFNINQAATNMDQRLKHVGIDKQYEQIIFVTHSMGGLVTQRLLLNYPKYAKKTPLVFFFATPQEGAEIANIGKLFIHNGGLPDMTPGDSYIDSLDEQWKQRQEDQAKDGSPKIIVKCAYEMKNIHGLPIVPKLSATRSCDGIGVPIYENHLDIVKPLNSESDSYIALSNAVSDIPDVKVDPNNYQNPVDVEKKKEQINGQFKNWPKIARTGSLEDVKSVIEQGAEPNKITSDGQTALHLAAKANRVDIVKYLLSINKLDKNAIDKDNATPLFLAAQNGSLNTVRELASAEADVDKAARVGGFILDAYWASPVAIASKEGYTEIVQFLAENFVDTNPVEREVEFIGANINYRPLRLALENNHYDIALILIGINATPKSGDLVMALESGDANLIQKMLEKGADPMDKDMDGKTVMQLAEDKHLTDIVALLSNWKKH